MFFELTSNCTAFFVFSSHVFKVTKVIQTQGDGLCNLLYPASTIQHTAVDYNFIWSLKKLCYSYMTEEITGVLG